jgi:hypothetical protein
MITIEKEGYTPVECDPPLPCPFCGSKPELAQVAHRTTWQRVGRSRKTEQVKVCIVASSQILTADTFWFRCTECRCTTGPHAKTAQEAAESWNKRV